LALIGACGGGMVGNATGHVARVLSWDKRVCGSGIHALVASISAVGGIGQIVRASSVSNASGDDAFRDLAGDSGHLRRSERLSSIQFALGNYVEPQRGRSFAVGVVNGVLFAIFFRTLLWGLFDTFIGLTNALAILSFCDQHPSISRVADLPGGPERSETRPVMSATSTLSPAHRALAQ
jgi:hypothetical protein